MRGSVAEKFDWRSLRSLINSSLNGRTALLLTQIEWGILLQGGESPVTRFAISQLKPPI